MFKKKSFCLVLFVLFISTNVFGAIDQYAVPSPVPLGKNLVISGHVDDNSTGTLCSFLIYDTNSGELIKRLSDELTNEGFFSTDYFQTTEPLMFRQNVYTATTNCGGSTASAQFTLDQRENIKNQVLGEALFVKENIVWLFLGLFFLILIVIFIAWMIWRGR